MLILTNLSGPQWGPERRFYETETSSPVITFLCIYKRVVSDEKYYILFVKALQLLELQFKQLKKGKNYV